MRNVDYFPYLIECGPYLPTCGVKWTFVISRKTVQFLSYQMQKTNIYTNLQ